MKKILPLLLFAGLCVGCANEENQGATAETSYNETKKMVVDILKTPEGKKALAEVMSDKEVQQTFVLNQEVVTSAIEKAFSTPKGKAFWEKAFQDPEFVKNYARGIRSEHMKLLKEVIKDPSYQQDVVNLLKSKGVEQEYLRVLQSPEGQKSLQKALLETIETPTFEFKLMEYVKKSTAQLTGPKKGT